MLTISEDGNMLRIFGRRILRMIYGPTDDMVYGKKDTIISFIRSMMN
jgi:hypothetical protein